MLTPTYTLETKLLKNHPLIAGVDEVGRGSLAGPVVAAVVILDPNRTGKYRSKNKWWEEVRDSKILSPRRRRFIAQFIRENALDFAIGESSNQEIDELNIHHASLLAMRRALENLKLQPDLVLLDGPFEIPYSKFDIRPVVDGDAKILSIAAASILAKVFRDNLMKKFDEIFPEYSFDEHKGYDTDFHRKELRVNGPCKIHRMTFAPVQEAINERFGSLINNP